MSLLARLLSAVLFCCLSAGAWPETTGTSTAYCPTLDAADDAARRNLMHYVCYYDAAPRQPGHDATTPEALPDDLTWRSAGGQDLVFSQTESVYWVRIHVLNSAPEQRLWYLKLNYPLLDEVTFWSRRERGTLTHIETGDLFPFDSRGIDYRYFLLPITLHGGEKTEITIRIHSSGALNVPLALETPEELIASSNRLTLTHGLFYGALLVLGVFNLLLFASSGTVYYFYNAFYTGAMGMFLFAMGGFANQFFWPGGTELTNTSIPLTLSLCALAMTLFGRAFLETHPGSRADRYLKNQAWVSVGFIALTFVLPYSKTILLNTVLALTVIGGLFTIAGIRWRQGYQPAIWYLLAWLVMLIGGLIYALAAFGYLADFLAHEALMQGAIGGQVVLLNYAMVQRWRLLNQKLLDVEHQARTELEFKVHERTSQLRSTMRELEKANRKLAALSVNDPLTGLYNRRHLDNIVPELCAEARRTGNSLSIALIDADRFKSINDTWGHAFGDVCLQRIAQVLNRHVKRPRDVAVRFGGEEFALILPGTHADGARALCDEILAELRETELESPAGEKLTLTLSAGVAELAADEDQDEWFQRADEALYRAKAEGRDRTVIAAPATVN